MRSNELRIAWIGPASREMTWLRQRVEQAGLRYGQPITHIFQPALEPTRSWTRESSVSGSSVSESSVRESPDSRALEPETHADHLGDEVDRVVICWSSRASYPWQTLAALEARTHSIPWAVATGSWIDGARRTGIGPVNHCQLPWYRWWEGWHPWFFPERARAGSLAQAHFAPVVGAADWARPTFSSDLREPGKEQDRQRRSVAIVAGCLETQNVWRNMAEHVGWSVGCARDIDELFDERKQPSTIANWHCVLIDDSLLAADNRMRFADMLAPLVARCQMVLAGCPIVVALGLEHLCHWPELRSVGVDDFVIKPSFGLSLADYLYSLSR